MRPARRRVARPVHRPGCARRPQPFARRLVVMVRLPVAGRVKTRLARDLGAVRTAAFYRHVTAAVLARVGGGRRWETWLAVTPDTARLSPAWPPSFARIPQGGGDLGQRMQRLMDRLPPGPVVIVGTDIPALTARHIGQAFAALGMNDAVFGPARDGGYWLVGMRRRPRVLRTFHAVGWSSDRALADTRTNLAGHVVALLDLLDDVDEAADLSRAGRAVGRRILPAG